MADEIYQAWQRLSAIEETACSDDGRVSVTVNARGELRAMRLDPRIYRTPDADRPADTIRTTAEDADLAFGPVLRILARSRNRMSGPT